MGAGDEVPASLQQLGVKVEMLSAKDLAFGELSRYSAIVTGIRAYNVNEDLKANNQRLIHYVEQGGTLIVQYNTPGRGIPRFPMAPFPMSNSAGDRITVEDSPVKILEPQHPILSSSQQDHAWRISRVGAGARTLLHDPMGQQVYASDLGK